MVQNIIRFAKGVIRHRTLVSVGIVVISLYIVPRIPYVNIYKSLLISIAIAVAVVYKIEYHARKLFLTASLMFLLLLFFTLIGDNEIIDYVGSAIYFVILIAVLSSVINLRAVK